MKFLRSFEPLSLLVLRLALALIFLYHGYPKLTHPTEQMREFFTSHGFPVYFVGLAGIIECFGALLLAAGLFTRPAAMVLAAIFLLCSLLLKKTFCSWLCPVGTVSEYLWKLGRKLFRDLTATLHQLALLDATLGFIVDGIEDCSLVGKKCAEPTDDQALQIAGRYAPAV